MCKNIQEYARRRALNGHRSVVEQPSLQRETKSRRPVFGDLD